MGTFIKSLCLTLLFFAYSFGIFCGGIFIEKRIEAVKQAEQAALEEQAKTESIKTPEEYHKYYEVVVSRIKTSEIEGLNKEAFKNYIADYENRYKAMKDIFYPDKKAENPENSEQETISTVPNSFIKAFDEIEINAYKTLLTSTVPAITEEEINLIFQEF